MNTLITSNGQSINRLQENKLFLSDHIDEPIKKCVVGLALLGFEPIFSCCAFSYKGEKVKKSHLNRPYIYINGNSLNDKLKCLLFDISHKSSWQITFCPGNIINLVGDTFNPNHPWSNPNSPHNYEQSLISISYLEKVLTLYKDLFFESAVIIDGNKNYPRMFNIKHWQYEVCDDWEVTKELYESL